MSQPGETLQPTRAFWARRAAMIHLQMLVATLVIPVIRPYVSELDGAHEWTMHAFLSINMLGAIVMAPLLGRLVDRGIGYWPAIRALTLIDGLLFVSMAFSHSATSALVFRFLEGAAHVSACSILLALTAHQARDSHRTGAIMGMAGSAIIFAIPAGSALGSLLLTGGTRFVLLVSAALSFGVFVAAMFESGEPDHGVRHAEPGTLRRLGAPGAVLVGAAFVERFAVGCLVVTFSLYCRQRFGLDDTHIGLLLSIMTGTFAVCVYPFARAGDRFPRAILLAAGTLGYASALFVLGIVPGVGIAPVMALLGISAATMFAGVLSYATEIAGPANRSFLMGSINAAGCLGMMLGPGFAAFISHAPAELAHDTMRFSRVFAFAAAVVIVWLAAASPWLVRQLARERARTAEAEAVG